jgi:hypothetical protein
MDILAKTRGFFTQLQAAGDEMLWTLSLYSVSFFVCLVFFVVNKPG